VERAYALLAIKSIAPAQRTFSGIASTPELDRQGDSFDPAGATFRESLPLLFHHDPKQPIGRVTLTRTPEGILFEASIPEVDEPGPFKTRVDEAWQSIKAGVITGVSIGHRVLEGGLERLKNGTRRITRSEICELSLVTIPANASASILTVKSLSKGPIMTIAERIQGLTQTRADLGLQMKNLMESAPAGSTLDETTAATVDGLKLQIKNCEADEIRWRDMEAVQMTKATAITSPYSHVAVTETVEPGIKFARYVLASIGCKYMHTDAVTYAQNRWGHSTPEVALALKAAVAAVESSSVLPSGALSIKLRICRPRSARVLVRL